MLTIQQTQFQVEEVAHIKELFLYIGLRAILVFYNHSLGASLFVCDFIRANSVTIFHGSYSKCIIVCRIYTRVLGDSIEAVFFQFLLQCFVSFCSKIVRAFSISSLSLCISYAFV